MEISNACSWKILKPIFDFTLQWWGKFFDVDIIILYLKQIKKILNILDMIFSSDLHIFSIKPGQIIDVIDREVMENRR